MSAITSMEEKNKLIKHILQSHTINISKYDDNFLMKSIQRRMSETGCKTLGDYNSFVLKDINEAGWFIDSLQVCYTEFFRNTLTFSVLEKIIIPSLVMRTLKSNRNEIRVWSAACASGQETYSIAMLLNEFSTVKGKKINFRIFATDQSELQILEAKLGRYTEKELNSVSLKRVNQWFTKSDATYDVKPQLKENIEFSVFDLLNEEYSCPPTSIYGDFDLVICSNLLFYYQPEYRKKIIEKVNHCMSENGYLVTGESEREILNQCGLREMYPMSGIFHI